MPSGPKRPPSAVLCVSAISARFLAVKKHAEAAESQRAAEKTMETAPVASLRSVLSKNQVSSSRADRFLFSPAQGFFTKSMADGIYLNDNCVYLIESILTLTLAGSLCHVPFTLEKIGLLACDGSETSAHSPGKPRFRNESVFFTLCRDRLCEQKGSRIAEQHG